MNERPHSSLTNPGSGQPLPKVNGTPTPRQRARKNLGRVLLAKSKSKIRDYQQCRFPNCQVRGVGKVESMHIENSGMGGRSSTGDDPSKLVTGCHDHHQGARSVHSKHLVMEPLTEAGGDGPVAFYERMTLTSPLLYVGTTRPPGPFRSTP